MHAAEAASTSLGMTVAAAAVQSRRGTWSMPLGLGEGAGRRPDRGTVSLCCQPDEDRITALASDLRLPAIYPFRYFATNGGLASYGFDTVEPHRNAASYVDRILKGEKPGNLPLQAPTKYELVINLKTAKAIGLRTFIATLILFI